MAGLKGRQSPGTGRSNITSKSFLSPRQRPQRYAGKEQFMKGFTKQFKRYPYPITIYQVGLEGQAGIIQQLEDSITKDNQILNTAIRTVGEKLAENFGTQGRSQGVQWKKLKKATLAKRNQAGYYANTAPLIRTGALEQAVTTHMMYFGPNSAGMNKTFGANHAIVRRKVKAARNMSKSGIGRLGGDQRDEVSVTIATKRGPEHSRAVMTIRGNSVINNTGGTSNGVEVPRRPFWFISSKMTSFSVMHIQGILDAYIKGANESLAKSKPSRRRITLVSTAAFDTDVNARGNASKMAFRAINATIDDELKKAGLVRKVNIRQILESKRRKEIENPFWMLSTGENVDFGDVVRTLQHRTGVKMSLRYAPHEDMPLFHKFRVRSRGRFTSVEVPIGPGFIEEMNQARLLRVNERRRARGLQPLEMKDIRTIKPNHAGRELASRMEIRAFTLLAAKVQLTRAQNRPYKRSWRKAIASFPAINPTYIMPYLMTSQQNDYSGIGRYASKHLSALRGRPGAFGSTLPEQLMLMRAEASYLETTHGSAIATPFRFSGSTKEGYQERALAIAAPAGMLVTDRYGKFFRTRAYGARTTEYGGDMIDVRLWRHSVATNLLESGTAEGLPVMQRMAQELLAHTTGTSLIKNIYGRYAFRGIVSDVEATTRRSEMPSELKTASGTVAFDPWTQSELHRNRYIQLTRTIDAIESMMQNAAEEAHYISTERFVYHASGMFRPRTKDRQQFWALEDIKALIDSRWRDANAEASRIAGKEMVTPYYFSVRRELSPAVNYESPAIAVLGLSARDIIPTVNKRYTVKEGRIVAVTRPHIDWYNREHNIFAIDVETARAAGVIGEENYRSFTPDIQELGRMNDRYFVASKQIIDSGDAIDRQTASDLWRQSFGGDWFHWTLTGNKPGQAYHKSDIYAPAEELTQITLNRNYEKQKASVIIRTIAEIEQLHPDYIDALTPTDRQQIRGARAVRSYLAKHQGDTGLQIEAFHRATKTKREQMREKIK